MASETAIAAAFGRFCVHYNRTPPEIEARMILVDWASGLANVSDEALGLAVAAWLTYEEWMPTMAGILAAAESEQHHLDRRRSERALPAPPRNDEPLGDAHEWAERIRAAVGLIEREDFGHSGFETRGHDHHNGAAGCPVCSRARAARESEPAWEPRERPLWSRCSRCDGTGFLEVGDNVVTPCEVCNSHVYSLWLGGHLEMNHRCELCAPRTVVGRSKMPETIRRHWGVGQKLNYVARVEQDITPPHPSRVGFCECCSADIGPIVYSGHHAGEMRWRFLCSECAASWVEAGGRVAVRCAR